MPVRLHFVVEGPTERRFVENILRPHLADRSIWVAARCVETSRSRGRKYSGGISWTLRISSGVSKGIYQSVVQSGRDFPYIRVGGGQ